MQRDGQLLFAALQCAIGLQQLQVGLGLHIQQVLRSLLHQYLEVLLRRAVVGIDEVNGKQQPQHANTHNNGKHAAHTGVIVVVIGRLLAVLLRNEIRNCHTQRIHAALSVPAVDLR